MTSRWLTAGFVHWRCATDLVQGYLPPGLTVDEYDGSAWLTIAPYVLADSRPLGTVPSPLSPTDHRGLNLRTYVRGPDGRDGLWFLSLDTSHPGLAAAGRAVLGAPYHWARVRVDRADGLVAYSGHRHTGPAAWDLALGIGEPLEQDERDIWLTGRWRAFTRRAGQLFVTPVEHEPWPLRAARIERCEQSLTEPFALPGPDEEPADVVVHFADGVHHVRSGWTRPL